MKQTTHTRTTIATWTACSGLILIMIATAMPIFHLGGQLFRWVYAVGAVLTLTGRALSQFDLPENLRLRRLVRMQLWSALLFAMAVFCLFYPGVRGTDWLAFTLAGGALQAYASFMTPRAAAPTNKK